MLISRRMTALAGWAVLSVAGCQQTQPETASPVSVSPQAQQAINDYLTKVHGRFGALAISADGTRAVPHICESHLWKNCDNYNLNDHFISIPSGRIAAGIALSRCGGGCRLLYVNEKRQS